MIAAEHVCEGTVFPVSGCFAVFTTRCATVGAAVGGGIVVAVIILVHFRDKVPEVVEIGHIVEWCCVVVE